MTPMKGLHVAADSLRFIRFCCIHMPAALFAAIMAFPAHADVSDVLSRIFGAGHTTTLETNTPDRHLKFKVNGTIVFTADEDDVLSLIGKAAILEERGGSARRIVFASDAGGVTRSYSVDGREQPWDADGRRWLAELLPTVIRETGLNSDQRIRRLHAAGGVVAVLNEIDRVQAEHVRRRYIEGLMKLASLNEPQLERVLAAVALLQSDYQQRKALHAMIATQTLSPASQVALLDNLARMESDFELRSVLSTLIPKMSANAKVIAAWEAAMDRIQSDFELRSVIVVMAKQDALSIPQLDAALRVTRNIDSNFERASALKSLLRHMPRATSAQHAAYLRSARDMDSDFERRGALVALMTRAKLDKAGWSALFDAVEDMDSDFEIGSVLAIAAGSMPADAELASRYRHIARRLANHERRRAERSLERSL